MKKKRGTRMEVRWNGWNREEAKGKKEDGFIDALPNHWIWPHRWFK